MGLPDASGEGIFPVWHSNQVNVVGHQAPGENRDTGLTGFLGKELEVDNAVAVVCENIHRPHTALGEVMGVTGNDNSGDSGHVTN